MTEILTEILIILALLVGNGVFAMTEIAVVSARKVRLRKLANEGDRKAQAALALAESPNRFLSTVQVGITLVGVLAGAFGGATVADKIATHLKEVSWAAPYANAISVALVVVVITYVSLIIGELVPKRIGLSNPEGIARVMSGPMNGISQLAKPVISFLGFSTDLVLKLIRLKSNREEQVSDDEVKMLMQEGMRSGVFHAAEPKMVESVLALDRLPVRDIMTPKPKIVFLNLNDPHEAVWHKIVVNAHSSFPVYEGDRDHVVGIVSVKSIYANLAAGTDTQLSNLIVPPLFVPAMQAVSQLLDLFKKTGKHTALVVDEFGAIVGLVTLVDVLEAIVGEIPSPYARLKPEMRLRPDGSWLIDGGFDIDEFQAALKVTLPKIPNQTYETIAGFVFAQFGQVPAENDSFLWNGFKFEVIDMDRHRIDKILVTPPHSTRA